MKFLNSIAECCTNCLKHFQNEYKLIKEPGHGELTGSVTGLGLIELPENSQIIFENIMVPRNLLYDVLIRYQVNYIPLSHFEETAHFFLFLTQFIFNMIFLMPH